MSKTYNFVADKIEVRSSLIDTPNPAYIVKGYAVVPNKKDIYKYERRKDGSLRTFKSMFTDDCIKDIKHQAKYKKIFVDSMHELGVNANIKSILKGKLSEEEMSKINSYLKTKQLPFAKLESLDIDDKGLFIDTRLNPAFRNFSEDYKNYYDAVWSSLENHYINGISINFTPVEVTKDEFGDDIINKVDIAGFSYIDSPALSDNNITEVAMRATIEFREGENMTEENKKKEEELKQEKEKIEVEKKALEEEKAKVAKEKEDAEKSDLEKQKEEQKKIQEDLDKRTEDLTKKEEELKAGNQTGGKEGETKPPTEGTKSVVQPQDKYGEAAQETKPIHDEKFYKEQVAEITKGHDETMKIKKEGKEPLSDRLMEGFGEMVNLQGQIGDPTLGIDERNRRYIHEEMPHILSKGNADIVIHK